MLLTGFECYLNSLEKKGKSLRSVAFDNDLFEFLFARFKSFYRISPSSMQNYKLCITEGFFQHFFQTEINIHDGNQTTTGKNLLQIIKMMNTFSIVTSSDIRIIYSSIRTRAQWNGFGCSPTQNSLVTLIICLVIKVDKNR